MTRKTEHETYRELAAESGVQRRRYAKAIADVRQRAQNAEAELETLKRELINTLVSIALGEAKPGAHSKLRARMAELKDTVDHSGEVISELLAREKPHADSQTMANQALDELDRARSQARIRAKAVELETRRPMDRKTLLEALRKDDPALTMPELERAMRR